MRELLSAALKTGSGSIGSLLLRIIAVKIMAVILGPSGIGLYSILRQAREFSSNLGIVGGNTAMVQGLASREGKDRDSYLITTFSICAVAATLVSFVLLAFAPWIAHLIFGRDDVEFIGLMRWLALPVVVGAASLYISGVLNGFRAIGRLALMQVLASIGTLLFAYPASLFVKSGYPIAFIFMMSASQAAVAGFGFWVALREGWLTPIVRNIRIRFYRDSLRHFLSISGTTLVVSSATMGTALAVRALVVRHAGLSGAGIFDVAWTLSMTYIMLVLSSFGTYYLPTLSGTSNPMERTLLMQRVLRFTTLLMVPIVTGVIVLKPLAIELLYSEQFTPALEIIRWMLIGDYFKVAAWVVAMPLLAYANMKVFFWTELLWNGGFLTFAAMALFAFDSLQSIGAGFLVMYILYLSFCLCYVRVRYQFHITKAMAATWLCGLILVIGASWHTWSSASVNWVAALFWASIAVAFSLLTLSSSERAKVIDMLLRRRGGQA